MSALRPENLRGTLTEKRKLIVRQTQAQIVGYLRGGAFNSLRLADIVNYIWLNANSANGINRTPRSCLHRPYSETTKKPPTISFDRICQGNRIKTWL